MPPVPATSTTGRLAWGELSTEDQQLHLQAQRTARVRVASLRLNHDEAVKRGLANRDIYSALAEQIDNARREFLRTYIAKTPTMVDYLHLEILASLAHNDEHLLGGGYPGPMV
jgi:hypothetical protein